MTPKRNGALARDCATSAGIIASSQGRATAAPNAPRRNVRRDRCFLVMIMAALSIRLKPDSTFLSHPGRWFGLQTRTHLERGTLDDPANYRLQRVIPWRRFFDDSANYGHIRRLHAAPQGVGHDSLDRKSVV